MAINFNTGPYYDDFDPTKNFYKVLYKPGYAVQARELNQMQSIQQHQLAGISNHIFQKNAMVIPGGVVLNHSADIVFLATSSTISDFSTLVGKTITNAPSFNATDDTTLDGYITAVVLAYRAADTVNSIPAALYVKYIKANADYRTTFNTAEALQTVELNPIAFTTDATFASRQGKVAILNTGLFYAKETFVDVEQQIIIVEVDNTNLTNAYLALQINESIVTSDDDQSLLDNALGSPNQYAPGADRYKISLTLTKVDLDNPLSTDTFIEMMKIENDVVTYLNDKTEYGDIMKMIARRTYDANGNFITAGLKTAMDESGDTNYVNVTVSAGKAYLGGYEYDQVSDITLPILKPRDAAHQEAVNNVSRFASGLTYFYAAGADITGIPPSNTLVQLLNASPTTSSVSVIGYALFRDLEYVTGNIGSSDIYKMFFDWISLEVGHTINDIGGYKIMSTGNGGPFLAQIAVTGLTGVIAAGDTLKSTTDSSQTGLVYHVSNTNTLYVIKNSLYAVPNTVTLVNTAGTPVFATLSTYFISNYDDLLIPMINVDNKIIKTLHNSDGVNTTAFSVVTKYVINPSSGNRSVAKTLNEYQTYQTFSTSDYYAYVVDTGAFIADLNSIISFDSGYTTLTFNLGSISDYDGMTIWLYATVNNSLVTESPKTSTTATINIATPSKTWMSLQHQDVINIVKITDSGNPANAANINTDTDITSRFVLLPNNTAHESNTSLIKLRKGATPPVGQIAVRYNYYSVGTGSYVSVDSYGDYTGDLAYIGKINHVYTQKKQLIKTRNYIDFRNRTSNYYFKNLAKIASGTAVLKLIDLNLTSVASSLVGKYVVGPGYPTGVAISSVAYDAPSGNTFITVASNVSGNQVGSYYIGLNGSSLSLVDTAAGGVSFTFPKDGTKLSYNYVRFKDKNVLIYLDRGSDDGIAVKQMEIQSLADVDKIRRNEHKMPMLFLYMDPYCVNLNDVQSKPYDNPVYTMLDIDALKARIARNEYYTSLALNPDLNQEVGVASNLPSTTSDQGFWNDDLMDPSSQDFNSPDFQCTIFDKSFVSPGAVLRSINLEVDPSLNTSTWQITGTAITLPYKSVRAFGNSNASVANNINPYGNVQPAAAAKLTLIPSVDNDVDTTCPPVVVSKPVITPTPNPPITVINPPKDIDPPHTKCEPAPVMPKPHDEDDIVTDIKNLLCAQARGHDSRGGFHAISFDWVTAQGKTGSVYTDIHLSPVVASKGFNGTYAKSLINKSYNDPGVKEYLNAGVHLTQKTPTSWATVLKTKPE
jgi:hypothetical protein